MQRPDANEPHPVPRPRHARSGLTRLALCVLLALLLCAPSSAAALTLPAGFEDQAVATVNLPTALAFTPDGRMLVTTQGGQLRVYQNGALLGTPAIDLAATTCANSERGLLGVAVDPAFQTNRFIYLFYTFRKFGVCEQNTANSPVNRVKRFVLGTNNLVDPDPGTQAVIVDNMPSPNGNHNAGDLQFGKDGNLYISIGDGGCDYAMDSGCAANNNAARDLHVLTGKVLRVRPDGTIPAGNPFTGTGTDRCNVTGRTTAGRRCQETYGWGLRNPWKLAFDSNSPTTVFHINDVGQAFWEEIDLGIAGADYGWNVREGHCAVNSTTNCGPPPAGMTNPIYDYGHGGGCTAVTGGAFVPNGIWPVQYDGRYLFSDLGCGKISRLDPAGGGTFTATDFATNAGANAFVGLTFGPHGTTQALYYLSYAAPGVRRIVYTGQANRPPVAQAQADRNGGSLPLTVNFDGSASSDPDGDPITYDWDFGDGSAHATSVSPSHTYTTAGIFTVTLRVRDSRGAESTDTLQIDAGNNPPTPTIATPAATEKFSVGEQLVLNGSATDAEDGPLGPGSLTWVVVKHHSTHTHPFLDATSGNGIPITGPAPEDLTSTTNSYLEIRLTATDSRGLTQTVTRDVQPQQVNLTFQASPAGRQVVVAASTLTTPQTIVSWDAWQLPVDAPNQTDAAGQSYTFISWSDGGSRAHDIATPAVPTTYTASFTQTYVRPKGAVLDFVSLVPAFKVCTTQNQNRSHGGGLTSPSCNLPQRESGQLTMGAPDANGRAANGRGSMRLQVQGGDPATPPDEADVTLMVMMEDVRVSATLLDYAGELMASVPLRVTDRLNGPSGEESGTVVDTPFRFAVPCTVTSDTAIGSSCATSTSADAVVPGSAPEGRKAIWELGQVQVFDGGPDGLAATAPNTLFATQGLFVP